ncbi:MAG: DUF433 domain-containing protein [Candidatus Asgardarchaeia archaeon]
MINYLDRIEVNLKIAGGKAIIIKGTRIPVYLILELKVNVKL